MASETAAPAAKNLSKTETPAIPKRHLPLWVMPSVVFVLATGLFLAITGRWTDLRSGATNQTTDDAYVHADLTPLSTKVSGVVAKVNVGDYQHVKAGQLLVQLKDDDFQAQVSQAQAGVEAAKAAIQDNHRQEQLQEAKIERALASAEESQAGITLAQSHIAAAKASLDRSGPERLRQEKLLTTQSTTTQKVEQAVAEEEGSRAQLASAEAAVEESEAALKSSESAVEAERRGLLVLKTQETRLAADLAARDAALAAARTNLDYTRICAPTDGVVGDRKVRPGQMVNPGTQVISLVENDLWVEANYRETQLRRVSVGDHAQIKIDAFPGIVLHGEVASLSPASGAQFSLLPPDNASGNFTKVTQRIPVKITFDPDARVTGRLRPGMSVIATVFVSGN